MTDIILTTLNAKYIHTAFGLRYLRANLGHLKEKSKIIEFTLENRVLDIVEQLLSEKPTIIGFGVYIWNITQLTEVIILIKKIAPEIYLVIGGPEVSYEIEEQVIFKFVDYVITGQGEVSFKQLAEQLLDQQKPIHKIIQGIPPVLSDLILPYQEYTQEDIQNRIIYVEASRGCPFKCEFCLSALDKTAYPFPLECFLQHMERLYQKGVRHFKFVDRTFNLKITTTIAILEFFLQYLDQDLFLHFELIPDYLPEKLKALILQFPKHSLQFEIGVQSLDSDVQTLISRKQDNQKSIENITWLQHHSNAHLHVDLIFGLPGQDLASFQRDFDQLNGINLDEIQLGILKRLRGTPIIRHTDTHLMLFNPHAPYNVLKTYHIDFSTMQKFTRFARYWDMIINSGRFKNTKPLILQDKPFVHFWNLSLWLYQTTQQTHKIALPRLFELLHSYLKEKINIYNLEYALLIDFQNNKLKGLPPFYKKNSEKLNINKGNKRQKKHNK